MLRSIGGLPAHIAGAFLATRSASSRPTAALYFVFDRRGHAVYTIADDGPAQKIIEVGAEPGACSIPTRVRHRPVRRQLRRRRRADPAASASRCSPPSGGRLGGFTLPGRELPRLTLDNMVLNGIGSLQYTGATILINQPERGCARDGADARRARRPARSASCARPATRAIANCTSRSTSACRSSIPPAASTSSSWPACRCSASTTRAGSSCSSGTSKAPRSTSTCSACRPRWPTRRTDDGDVLPLVPPAVRTAGVDYQGNLWISLTAPFTYVYDRSGDKIRTVQFKGADVLAPNSLFFTKDDRVLVTPGAMCSGPRVDGRVGSDAGPTGHGPRSCDRTLGPRSTSASPPAPDRGSVPQARCRTASRDPESSPAGA